MKRIMTGCAVPILIGAIFFGGYGFLFIPRVEPVWLAYVLAGVGALLLYLVLGAIKTLFQARVIATVLRRARQMQLPDDGQMALVQGEIVAVGETIRAPFSNTPCVSYEYDVSRTVRTNSRQETGYRTAKESYAFGLAKTAYVIRTVMGDVRPLGYPTLDHLAKTSWLVSDRDLDSYTQQGARMNGSNETELAQVNQRAQKFLQGEHMHQVSGLDMAGAFAKMIETIEQETDFVRKDWRVGGSEDLNGATLYETRLEPGSQVCALGKWDQARSALHPPVELIAGDLEDAQRILVADKRSSALLGLAFGILTSVILWVFVLFSFPL